jgi:hypothetical protein
MMAMPPLDHYIRMQGIDCVRCRIEWKGGSMIIKRCSKAGDFIFDMQLWVWWWRSVIWLGYLAGIDRSEWLHRGAWKRYKHLNMSLGWYHHICQNGSSRLMPRRIRLREMRRVGNYPSIINDGTEKWVDL